MYVAECPGLYMYMPVTNVCTMIVYYIYHACDVFYSTLYRAWPTLLSRLAGGFTNPW